MKKKYNYKNFLIGYVYVYDTYFIEFSESYHYLTNDFRKISIENIPRSNEEIKKYFYFDTKQSAINAIEYYLESLEFIKEEEFMV